jgi:protoporphyrinogen oxidase
MRALVIGAGLGGLLAACALAERGFEVQVHERLPYPGGRFTNLEFEGYQLSTGALHMIPHGRRGPLAGMLAELGAEVEIIPSQPQAVFRVNGRDYEADELHAVLSAREKMRAVKLLAMMKLGRADAGEESYAEWLGRHMRSEVVRRIADAFTGWCLSLRAHQVPAREVLAQVANLARLGETGVPRGGCRGVVELWSK